MVESPHAELDSFRGPQRMSSVLAAPGPDRKSGRVVEIEEDYGSYKCIAKNSRGETDGTIRLYKSLPPSTSPSPSTTELPKKDWELMAEINNSVYGNPSSLTIHNERNTKNGNKFQSSLSEIGKSEQKSSDPDRKRNYNWPPDSDSSAAITTTGVLLIIAMVLVSITR
nr:uncharacterized protein LOC116425277 [Nomia melanderi]